jgi:hypothetical protein
MDIVRRRTVKTAAPTQLNPFKDGSKRLKAGFKYVGNGVIEHIETKTRIKPL